MIVEIRDYFNSVISQVDQDLIFDGFALDTDKIGHTIIDNSYKLILGNSNISRIDSSYINNMEVEINIFKSSGFESIIDFDKIYCKSIEIASLSQDQTKITQSGFIKSVICNDITPTNFDNNDNAFKMSIRFLVSVYFELEN